MKPRLAIFFSHPTQHHSTLFRALAQRGLLDVSVYYYSHGLNARSIDKGFGTRHSWDVDLLSGYPSRVLWSPVPDPVQSPLRQVNPGVVVPLLSERFDAVFISGYVSPSNNLVARLAKARGAKVLYQSDTNIRDVERRPYRSAQDFVRARLFAHVDRFLYIGDHNREAYEHFGVPSEKMYWSPYPVDLARFVAVRDAKDAAERRRATRDDLGLPEGAIVAAFCGKLIPRKRAEDFVDAVASLRAHGIYGLIIGSGEQEGTLRRRAAGAANIVFAGFTNQSRIPVLMHSADIGVVCSEWDPHPLVTTEFAALGLPVVVSHFCGVHGPNDILLPGENGLVYRCGNVAALTDALRALVGNAATRCRFGAKSAQRAATQSADSAATQIEGLVTRLRRAANQ
jgi:glycosyltransferase involved in cell wall biosynthesis